MGQNKRLTVIIQFGSGNTRKKENILWTTVTWMKRLLGLASVIASLLRLALS